MIRKVEVVKEDKVKALARFIRLVEKEKNLEGLLNEILTESEIDKIHERIRILDCLEQGMSQRQTYQHVGAAIATVTRGASLLKKSPLIVVNILHRARLLSWWRKLFWRA